MSKNSTKQITANNYSVDLYPADQYLKKKGIQTFPTAKSILQGPLKDDTSKKKHA